MNNITGVYDGLLYDANSDDEIIKVRKKVKFACFEYNNSHPEETSLRLTILKNLLGACGDSIYIEPPFYCDYGSNIVIGERFYSNHNLVILDCAKVEIGHDVFIAPNVGILTAGHPLDVERRAKGLEYALPVSIGNNVWIGAGVNILPGVKIGNNVVIGAGSVVTRDIPDNVIAVGNPCRVLREVNEQDKHRTDFSA